MAVPHDEVNPPLPDDAGPHERRLYGIYGFSSGLVRMSATDWGKTSGAVTGLSQDVRNVVKALQGADEPWEGPAADGAYQTLHTLSASLDQRAAELEDVKKSLELAAGAADDARIAYLTKVRRVSTDVDPTVYRPTDGGTFDTAGYDAAVDDKRAQRETAARNVLESFSADMGQAAKKMPVETSRDNVRIDPGTGGGGTPPGGGPSGGSSGGTTYHPPSTTGTGPTTTTVSTGPDPEQPHPQPHPQPVPQSPTHTPDPHAPGTGGGVDLDGGTTGTTAPSSGGSTAWAGTTPGSGPSGSTSGGVGAGAAGAGGLLGGGAMLLGRGGLGRGGAFGLPGTGGAGRPGAVVSGSTGASGRGAAARGAHAHPPVPAVPVLAPGSQGQARGGRGGGSSVRGARSGGRYGVPKLGGSGGSAGSGRGVVAGSGAGGRGRKDRDESVDVESLTHEDEETWFEGEGESGPSVWR